ncbi:MAG: presqualene diphosphate synthase HpnD [Candidatus Zixiibacteriota bacterium]
MSELDASVRRAYAACDDIARRDKPHLYACARHFVHAETRAAFAATYASMRVIDDFIDEIPNRAQITSDVREAASEHVNQWMKHVRAALVGDALKNPIWTALADTFRRFPIPLNPWNDLATAMVTDLFVPQFEDWDHLKRYMKGASVAPAIVFMHFVLMHPNGDGTFRCAWEYDRVANATEDLAIFCYWVHILRDVARDLSLGKTGLVYFPRADMERFGLTIQDLHSMKERGSASPAYLELANFEAGRARHHLEQGMAHVPAILADAMTEHGHALTTLVDTYAALLEELASRRFDVFSKPVELSQDRLSEIQR